jgi:hypothetical protein
MDLYFWWFNLVHNILKNAKEDYVAIGSRLDPEKAYTIESALYEEAKMKNYSSARAPPKTPHPQLNN